MKWFSSKWTHNVHLASTINIVRVVGTRMGVKDGPISPPKVWNSAKTGTLEEEEKKKKWLLLDF
jgi:hypothetical protein